MTSRNEHHVDTVRMKYDNHVCDSIHKTCTIIKQKIIITLRRGHGSNVPPLIKKLFVIDAFWEEKNQLAPVRCYQVYKPHSGRPHAQEQLAKSKWTQQFSCACFLFVWVLCLMFLIFLYGFIFSFPSIGRRRRERKYGRSNKRVADSIGRWQNRGQSQRWMKEYDKIYCNKF